jgi:hypothetical protein
MIKIKYNILDSINILNYILKLYLTNRYNEIIDNFTFVCFKELNFFLTILLLFFICII